MRKYAQMSWAPEDVQTLHEGLTTEQAEAFLARNEKFMVDRLVELGWDVLETFLTMDQREGLIPPNDDEGGTD